MINSFIPVINTVSVMFIMLIVGFIGYKTGIINDTASKKMSEIIIKIAQPFMIAGSVLSIEYKKDSLLTGGKIMLFAFVCYFILAVLAILFTFFYKDKSEKHVTEYSLIFTNGAFIGFPILRSVFPDFGVFWGSFYVIVYNLVVWTYGMYVLSKANKDIKMSFKKVILNYGTVPCIIALIIYSFGIKVPEIASTAMKYIGSICTPVSMLIIGALIASMSLKELFLDKKIYYFSFIKLFVIPLIIALIASLFKLDHDIVIFLTVMNCLSTSASTTMFCETYDVAPKYAAKCVGISTLLSVFTVPFVIYLAEKLYTLLH